VLSGMTTYEQVDDNTKTMADFKPLTEAERETVREAVAAFARLPSIPCTSCRYCMDECPKKIDIPAIIGMLNEYEKYQSAVSQKFGYSMATARGGKASSCLGCTRCEKPCPQNIAITEQLQSAAGRVD